jgi:hypothetical protein
MARLWTGGAELQSTANNVEFSASITTAPAVETSTKRSGNAAWRISNAAAIEGFRQIHTAAQGSFFFRFYLRIVAMPTNTRVIGGARITGSNKISIRLTAGGALQLYNSEDSAQVGSDSSALSLNTWYRIELTYDSTTLASTTCEAKIDGTAFASGTVDLAATPTSFGCYIDAADATLDYIVDDLAINDTSGTSSQTGYPGDEKVFAMRPNGNGDNSAWTGSDADSTDNYLLVDETPPDSADYVQSNTSGQIDDYNLTPTPAELGASDTINVVHVGVFGAIDDATSADPNLKLRFKASAGGTVEESATIDCNSTTYHGPAPLSADDNYKLTLYDMPGASTTGITKADLDQSQAGVIEDITDANFIRVAALWVMVGFTPAVGGATVVKDMIGSGIIPFAR